MRLVIATSMEDPLAAAFWQTYAEAGGPSPHAVFFISSRRHMSLTRKMLEALLLFGPADTLRLWRAGRRLRKILQGSSARIFPGAEIYRVDSLNRGEGLAILKDLAPTLLASVGAPEIFKRSVLDLPTAGAVNFHNGRLPAYRGLFGTFWEMRRGEQLGYASLHMMLPKVDTGPVLAEAAVPINGRRLLPVLFAKKREGARLLAWLVTYVEREGTLPPSRPEIEPGSSYYGWPGWRDLVAFRVALFRPRKEAAAGVVTSWPPGVLGDER